MVVLPKLTYKYNAIAVKHKQYYFVLFGFILELREHDYKVHMENKLEKLLGKALKKNNNKGDSLYQILKQVIKSL